MTECPHKMVVPGYEWSPDCKVAPAQCKGKERQCTRKPDKGWWDCRRFLRAENDRLREALRKADELAGAGKDECTYCYGVWIHTTLALAGIVMPAAAVPDKP